MATLLRIALTWCLQILVQVNSPDLVISFSCSGIISDGLWKPNVNIETNLGVILVVARALVLDEEPWIWFLGPSSGSYS